MKNYYIISLIIFSIFLFFTSLVKNETRIIEKKINLIQKENFDLNTKILENELDFFYLSSPAMLKSKIEKISDREYNPVNILNIYESISEYENFISKSVVKKKYDKKKEKK